MMGTDLDDPCPTGRPPLFRDPIPVRRRVVSPVRREACVDDPCEVSERGVPLDGLLDEIRPHQRRKQQQDRQAGGAHEAAFPGTHSTLRQTSRPGPVIVFLGPYVVYLAAWLSSGPAAPAR